jgi:hypothetical protein
MTDKISSATSVEVAKATSGRIAIALRSLSDRFFPLLSARGIETADGAWEEIDNVSREDPLAPRIQENGVKPLRPLVMGEKFRTMAPTAVAQYKEFLIKWQTENAIYINAKPDGVRQRISFGGNLSFCGQTLTISETPGRWRAI